MQTDDGAAAPRWAALERNQRRVLGVLVEKAKTTPDNYPLSLNALRSGCNQKSNRFPQMELEEHHVEEAIDGLRHCGAVTIIQGDARVEKYRHRAYDWLGVDKLELAVMAELLLRGAQTVGELRGRAARMEPIKGMTELQPLLASLVEKNLVLYLTPPGRGAVVTHNLYQPQELEKVRRDQGAAVVSQPVTASAEATASASAAAAATGSAVGSGGPAAGVADWRAELAALRAELQDEIETLRGEVESLRQRFGG